MAFPLSHIIRSIITSITLPPPHSANFRQLINHSSILDNLVTFRLDYPSHWPLYLPLWLNYSRVEYRKGRIGVNTSISFVTITFVLKERKLWWVFL